MILAVEQEYIEILKDMQLVVHNIYDIIGFLLVCFTVYMLYKLFNSFF